MQFLSNTNIQFIQNRKYGYIISSILILAGIISLVMHGGPKYNIDFTGGTLIHLKFEKPVEIESIRSAIGSKGYGDAEILDMFQQPDVVVDESGYDDAFTSGVFFIFMDIEVFEYLC